MSRSLCISNLTTVWILSGLNCDLQLQGSCFLNGINNVSLSICEKEILGRKSRWLEPLCFLPSWEEYYFQMLFPLCLIQLKGLFPAPFLFGHVFCPTHCAKRTLVKTLIIGINQAFWLARLEAFADKLC